MYNKQLIFLSFFLISATVEAQQIESNVVVESLSDLSLNTLGTDQGFDSDIWSASNPETLLALIDQIGTFPLTAASEKAIIRILNQDLTGSSFNDSQNLFKKDVFLTTRLQALFRLGDWDHILKLINLIPENQQSDSIQKIKISTLLMKGETSKACDLLNQKDLGTYTDKMRVSCFLAREEKEKAILAYDIYQENDDKTDLLFNALGDIVLREIPAQIPSQFTIGPEHVFLFSLLKNPIVDWEKQSNGIKKTLVDLPTTDIPLRIQLGEQLHLTAEEMMRLYKLPLMNQEINTPPLKRAFLFQKFKNAQEELGRTHLLSELMDSAQKSHLLLNLAPFFQELLNEISLHSSHQDIAFNAVQIYGIQDHLSAAAAWYKILDDDTNTHIQKQKLLLAPLMNQLGADFPEDIDQLINTFCPGKTDALCTHFWSIFPQQIHGEEQFEQNVNSSSDKWVKNSSKIGENLLKALFELNHFETNGQAALTFIKSIKPFEIGRQLERERMLFQ